MQPNEINQKNAYELMRSDLDKSLARSHIEPSKLSPFQRILLTTDGTLTEILEAYLFEPLQIVKLSEEIILTTQDIPPLDLKSGSEVIERKVLLQGKISRKNFIYAESRLVADRLEPKFRDELLKSQIPMGRLWLEHKIETFKEIIDSSQELAENLSNYFKIQTEDRMLSRTYRVFSNHQPIMMITEKFPESYFLKDL
jgi:chorismate-pyruvate lyase